MSDSTRARAAIAERWSLPAVDGPILGVRRDPPAAGSPAGQRAAARQEEEMERGYEAGVNAGRAELKSQTDAMATRIARMDEILQQLARPMTGLDAEVEQQLVLLALAVGKQLARRELKTDPGQITALIREAVGRLPAAAREVRIHLHPEDAASVAERLASAGQERAWSVVEDPTLSRGGCLVRSENSQIDARLESRVNAIVGSMLGEERAEARLAEAAEAEAEQAAAATQSDERGEADA